VETRSAARVPVIGPGAFVVATVVCGALSACAWHTRGPVGWERPIIVALRHEPPPFAHGLLLLWQPFPLVVSTLGLAWIASRSGRLALALFGSAGCVLAVFVTECVLKPLVGRQHLYQSSAVFPSGHVTAAAAWAMFAWLVVSPRSLLRPALLLVPIAVSWAAIATGVHYPSDVIAGALVGGMIVYGTVTAADRIGTRRPAAVIDLRATDHDRLTAGDRPSPSPATS